MQSINLCQPHVAGLALAIDEITLSGRIQLRAYQTMRFALSPGHQISNHLLLDRR